MERRIKKTEVESLYSKKEQQTRRVEIYRTEWRKKQKHHDIKNTSSKSKTVLSAVLHMYMYEDFAALLKIKYYT